MILKGKIQGKELLQLYKDAYTKKILEKLTYLWR